jgi:hypothetical protein
MTATTYAVMKVVSGSWEQFFRSGILLSSGLSVFLGEDGQQSGEVKAVTIIETISV